MLKKIVLEPNGGQFVVTENKRFFNALLMDLFKQRIRLSRTNWTHTIILCKFNH